MEHPPGMLFPMDSDEKYQALLRSDPAYEGRFFFAVRTTGVFCRPTCRARKPKPENVEFFADTRQALLAGYRPCKLCHPLETAEPVPAAIAGLLAEVEANPAGRIRDDELRRRGLEPETVRRWFKKHHGLTFQGYQRARRLGEAFGLIREGKPVAVAAMDAGFGSLSAFNDSFRKGFGATPTKTAATGIIRLTRLETPLGLMVAAAVEEGICLLEFAERRALETELDDLRRLLSAEVLPGPSPWFPRLRDQLAAYFAGASAGFDLPLVTPGTPFQKAVWQELRRIPYGTTRSYRDQAAALGQPAAVRAVARANGQNRIAIIIPCHRVIGADGSLTGYSGGIWRKQWLLDLEAGRLKSRKSPSIRKEPHPLTKSRKAGPPGGRN